MNDLVFDDMVDGDARCVVMCPTHAFALRPVMNPAFLFASDDPETVRSPGRLLTANLDATSPCRLYFDHVNGTNNPLRLVVVVRNLTSEDAPLNVLPALGVLNGNGMFAGHAASKALLLNRERSVPAPQQLAAGDASILYNQIIKPGICGCGIFELSTTATEPLEVQVLALDPNVDPVAACDDADPAPPDRYNRKAMVDLSGQTPDVVTYAVGDPQKDYQIGDRPLPNLIIDPVVPNPVDFQGEFCIIRSVQFNISNPTAAEQSIALSMSPRGGDASATFKLDGVWYEISRAPQTKYYRLATRTLAPNANLTMELVTAAEINSSYPVTFRIDLDRPTLSAITMTRC